MDANNNEDPHDNGSSLYYSYGLTTALNYGFKGLSIGVEVGYLFFDGEFDTADGKANTSGSGVASSFTIGSDLN